MRAVYCPACHRVSTLFRLEPEACPRCGHDALPTDLRRPWQYYASAAVLVVATGYIVLANPDVLLRWTIFLSAVVAAAVLAIWSARTLKSRVVEEIAAREAKGDRA